uniref:SERPIN domain-containing protein n=1 Tax=Parastrongyloides trichosuri TaxID=131310 RepID=A0A0N4ZGJ7_PARTI
MTRNLSILHADVALKVLNNLDTNSSIVYSPISLAIAMSMVYLGSNGDTKAEIKKFLIGDVDDEILHQRFNHFISHLNSNLKCANKMYVRDGLRLEEEFVRKLSIFYNGQIEQVNFSDLDTVDIINKYVEEATNNVIKDLISQRDIHEDTSTILINAIHFKGQWKKKFDNYDTSSSEFFITQDETKMVDMMLLR